MRPRYKGLTKVKLGAERWKRVFKNEAYTIVNGSLAKVARHGDGIRTRRQGERQKAEAQVDDGSEVEEDDIEPLETDQESKVNEHHGAGEKADGHSGCNGLEAEMSFPDS